MTMGLPDCRDVFGNNRQFFGRHIALLVLYATSCSAIFQFQETRKYDFLCLFICLILCFDASITVFLYLSPFVFLSLSPIVRDSKRNILLPD